jgi:hypothetical protein
VSRRGVAQTLVGQLIVRGHAKVDRSTLLIGLGHFIAADLTQPFTADARYDLAVCIEVAEHLPRVHANTLIERLTSLAPAILFSAAIPGQGGVNHINEQWPEYWCDLFAKRDFAMFDALRPPIRDDSQIAFWVRQHAFLFISNTASLLSDAQVPRSVKPGDRLQVGVCGPLREMAERSDQDSRCKRDPVRASYCYPQVASPAASMAAISVLLI